MERVWLTRLRWRLRGALMWPLAGLLLVVDAVLIHELPFAGGGPDWFLSVLLAGFFTLLVVAVAAPLGGRLVRRRRPDLPVVLVSAYTGPILTQQALAAGVSELLTKPLQPREIATTLARVLHPASVTS